MAATSTGSSPDSPKTLKDGRPARQLMFAKRLAATLCQRATLHAFEKEIEQLDDVLIPRPKDGEQTFKRRMTPQTLKEVAADCKTKLEKMEKELEEAEAVLNGTQEKTDPPSSEVQKDEPEPFPKTGTLYLQDAEFFLGDKMILHNGFFRTTFGTHGKVRRMGDQVTFTYDSGTHIECHIDEDGEVVGDASDEVYERLEPLSLLSASGDAEIHSISDLIRRQCIGLVKGEYFEDCFDRSQPYQKRQDIPACYFWKPDEAIKCWEKCGQRFMCVISYCWLSPEHPDPDMFHLRRLVCILRRVKAHWQNYGGPPDIAIAIDFCSLWQKAGKVDQRDTSQKEQFNEGLAGFNGLYGHEHVTSIKLRDVPIGEKRTYEDRGWTLGESCIIDAKPGSHNRFSFENFDPDDENLQTGFAFISAAFGKGQPPVEPEALDKELDKRQRRAEALGVNLFTCGGDAEILRKVYRKTFASLKQKHTLCCNFRTSRWGDPPVRILSQFLPQISVVMIALNGNDISDEVAPVLCEALCKCPGLKMLFLQQNLITEASIDHLVNLVAHPPLRGLIMDSIGEMDDKLHEVWRGAGKNPVLLDASQQCAQGSIKKDRTRSLSSLGKVSTSRSLQSNHSQSGALGISPVTSTRSEILVCTKPEILRQVSEHTQTTLPETTLPSWQVSEDAETTLPSRQVSEDVETIVPEL